jgi:hypothetical protein
MFGDNFDIEGLISNPAVMNMAQRFISDSNAQNFFGQMVNSLGTNGGAPGAAPAEVPSAPLDQSTAPGAPGGDNDFMQFLRA